MILVDEARGVVIEQTGGVDTAHPIGSPEAFRLLTRAWLRCGWDTKFVYSFTWLGRPVIQLPEDLLRIQETIWRVRPDVIVETGIAHGGSLVFYASLCRLIGHGRVIGIDIDIRASNRAAIEAHEMFPLIDLIEGDSIDPSVVAQVAGSIRPGESVLAILDGKHTKAHVRAELESYAPLVSPGSYIVACDGIMAELAGAPRTQNDWTVNNPRAAAADFVAEHPEFVLERPLPPFNEGTAPDVVTYWPGGYVKRLR